MQALAVVLAFPVPFAIFAHGKHFFVESTKELGSEQIQVLFAWKAKVRLHWHYFAFDVLTFPVLFANPVHMKHLPDASTMEFAAQRQAVELAVWFQIYVAVQMQALAVALALPVPFKILVQGKHLPVESIKELASGHMHVLLAWKTKFVLHWHSLIFVVLTFPVLFPKPVHRKHFCAASTMELAAQRHEVELLVPFQR
jgi:hypothetical protein